jgi:hypothetical protein
LYFELTIDFLRLNYDLTIATGCNVIRMKHL